ncbi:MAG: hypothetical protein ABEI86_10990, partial [Halobacteriaceae archaeon]
VGFEDSGEVVDVPVFEISKILEIESSKLDSTVLIEQEEEQIFSVPQISTESEIEFESRELEVDMAEIDQKEAVEIPQIRVGDFETFKPYSPLLHESPVSITETVEEEEQEE